MNWDSIEGSWKQLQSRVRQQWGKLTDDEIDKIAGKREQLAGHIQKAYGVSKDEAERQIEQFQSSLPGDREPRPDKRPRDENRAHQG